MIQVMRNMEKVAIDTRGEINKLCSVTRELQTKLETKFSVSSSKQYQVYCRETQAYISSREGLYIVRQFTDEF